MSSAETESKLDLLTEADVKAGQRRFAVHPVPMVDGKSVRIRSLFETEQSAFESRQVTSRGKLNTNELERGRRRYIALCVVNADGNPYLAEKSLEQWDSALVNWLYDRCCEHNGVREQDREALVGNC